MNDADDAREDVQTFLRFGRYDWFVAKSWNLLHYADIPDSALHWIETEWAILEPVKLACGRTAAALYIPGMFTRMGARRCSGCCRALSYPQGKGSPKNDNACRILLGLPVRTGT